MKDILKHFETFPASSRDQLLRLFYGGDKKKIPTLNEKLLKLRDRGLIDVNKEIKPYVYFSVPLRVKKRSNKLDHHLAIVNFWIKMIESGKPPAILGYEYNFGENMARPDLIITWGNKPYFVEIQRTIISQKRMEKKIKLYEEVYIEKKYKQFGDDFVVWLISPVQYDIKTKLNVKQNIMKL